MCDREMGSRKWGGSGRERRQDGRKRKEYRDQVRKIKGKWKKDKPFNSPLFLFEDDE